MPAPRHKPQHHNHTPITSRTNSDDNCHSQHLHRCCESRFSIRCHSDCLGCGKNNKSVVERPHPFSPREPWAQCTCDSAHWHQHLCSLVCDVESVGQQSGSTKNPNCVSTNAGTTNNKERKFGSKEATNENSKKHQHTTGRRAADRRHRHNPTTRILREYIRKRTGLVGICCLFGWFALWQVGNVPKELMVHRSKTLFQPKGSTAK